MLAHSAVEVEEVRQRVVVVLRATLRRVRSAGAALLARVDANQLTVRLVRELRAERDVELEALRRDSKAPVSVPSTFVRSIAALICPRGHDRVHEQSVFSRQEHLSACRVDVATERRVE